MDKLTDKEELFIFSYTFDSMYILKLNIYGKKFTRPITICKVFGLTIEELFNITQENNGIMIINKFIFFKNINNFNNVKEYLYNLYIANKLRGYDWGDLL